jgi:hypothetical protein
VKGLLALVLTFTVAACTVNARPASVVPAVGQWERFYSPYNAVRVGPDGRVTA